MKTYICKEGYTVRVYPGETDMYAENSEWRLVTQEELDKDMIKEDRGKVHEWVTEKLMHLSRIIYESNLQVNRYEKARNEAQKSFLELLRLKEFPLVEPDDIEG